MPPKFANLSQYLGQSQPQPPPMNNYSGSSLAALRLLGDSAPYQQNAQGNYDRDAGAARNPQPQMQAAASQGYSPSQLSALRLLGDTAPYQQNNQNGLYSKDTDKRDPKIQALRQMMDRQRGGV